jgi:carboxymethylenebutenolidase
MEITSEYVQLSVNDSTTMRAWVARPKEKGANPGLLVFQEAFGVNAHIRDIAGRFAREGFVARDATHEGLERCFDGGRPARCV